MKKEIVVCDHDHKKLYYRDKQTWNTISEKLYCSKCKKIFDLKEVAKNEEKVAKKGCK